MLQEGLHFLAFFLVTTAALKIAAAWLLHNYPGSQVGQAVDWFLTPV